MGMRRAGRLWGERRRARNLGSAYVPPPDSYAQMQYDLQVEMEKLRQQIAEKLDEARELEKVEKAREKERQMKNARGKGEGEEQLVTCNFSQVPHLRSLACGEPVLAVNREPEVNEVEVPQGFVPGGFVPASRAGESYERDEVAEKEAAKGKRKGVTETPEVRAARRDREKAERQERLDRLPVRVLFKRDGVCPCCLESGYHRDDCKLLEEMRGARRDKVRAEAIRDAVACPAVGCDAEIGEPCRFPSVKQVGARRGTHILRVSAYVDSLNVSESVGDFSQVAEPKTLLGTLAKREAAREERRKRVHRSGTGAKVTYQVLYRGSMRVLRCRCGDEFSGRRAGDSWREHCRSESERLDQPESFVLVGPGPGEVQSSLYKKVPAEARAYVDADMYHTSPEVYARRPELDEWISATLGTDEWRLWLVASITLSDDKLWLECWREAGARFSLSRSVRVLPLRTPPPAWLLALQDA